jgi:hypothetical protein
MKEPDSGLDFCPGSEHGHGAQEEREHQQEQAQAIQRKVKINSERRHPVPIDLLDPAPRRCWLEKIA